MIAEVALGGQILSHWWGDNWHEGRTRIIQGRGGHTSSVWSGQVEEKGYHVWFGRRYEGEPASVHDHDFDSRVREPDAVITWQELHDIITKGATPDRKKRYSDAYREYVEHARTPLPHPPLHWREVERLGLDPGWHHKDPENIAHTEAGSRIHHELHEAHRAIVVAGCERTQPQEQMGLW